MIELFDPFCKVLAMNDKFMFSRKHPETQPYMHMLGITSPSPRGDLLMFLQPLWW